VRYIRNSTIAGRQNQDIFFIPKKIFGGFRGKRQARCPLPFAQGLRATLKPQRYKGRLGGPSRKRKDKTPPGIEFAAAKKSS
jgi:hypothetical protein